MYADRILYTTLIPLKIYYRHTPLVINTRLWFTKLNSVSGFNSGNIMKHVYVDTLKDKHSKVPLYVDYKKVPMMVQADGNTKRIQDLNGGPVPGV